MSSLSSAGQRAGWSPARRNRQSLGLVLALAAAALVALPILGVLGSVVYAPGSLETLQHLAATVIPRAALETFLLVVMVMLGVTVLGTTSAWLVAAHEFPGRRIFEWALLLPLAMPGYIVAYAYTDFLQFSGPVQSALRASFGWTRADYWFPEIRSLPGAAFVFTVVLYPYVYLLARTAFLSRTASMIDAARSLGLSPWRTWLSVNLPLARPAVAAGALLALMEALADYGAAAYFGLQTFTTSIYRAWFSLGDRLAASQLAAVLLVLVLIIIAVERHLRGRARYFSAPNSARPASRQHLTGTAGSLAVLACLVPLVTGFMLPTAILVHLLLPTLDATLWGRFLGWLTNSVLIAGAAAVLTLATVLVLSYLQRMQSGRAGVLVGWAVRTMNLGYAVPGAVIAVGVLVPMAAFDNWLDAWLRASFGVSSGLLVTGTVAALLYAYLVRYFAVAQQPVEAGLARITPAMDASARSLGASPVEVFRRVHLPLLSPSLLAAALLVFVDVMKELPATLVLRPFNFDTLAVIAYQMAADERLGEAALPSLTIVLMGLVPVIWLSRAIGKASGTAGGGEAS
ncbi:MAG: ABC transporter permease [Betaproteobacteria bacterium]|jgi:iron(III) transport system permease protein